MQIGAYSDSANKTLPARHKHPLMNNVDEGHKGCCPCHADHSRVTFSFHLWRITDAPSTPSMCRRPHPGVNITHVPGVQLRSLSLSHGLYLHRVVHHALVSSPVVDACSVGARLAPRHAVVAADAAGG